MGAVVGTFIGVGVLIGIVTCIMQRNGWGNERPRGMVALPKDVTVVTLSELGNAYLAASAAAESAGAPPPPAGPAYYPSAAGTPDTDRLARVQAALRGQAPPEEEARLAAPPSPGETDESRRQRVQRLQAAAAPGAALGAPHV